MKTVGDANPPLLEANFVVTTFRFVPEDKRIKDTSGKKGGKGRRRK